MPNKSHHVVRAKEGWSVKKGGAERASKSFDRKDDAVNYAREISKNQRSELYIHKKDGTIENTESHSQDAGPKEKKELE